MDLIKSYSLVKSQDGYDLVLYFDAGTMDVEFANELGGLYMDNNSINQDIMQQYISDKFPNININTVKIMAGAVPLSSFKME